MSESIDLVYDRLLAEEKLKSGTKYERLAAIVFFVLTKRTTVHDLKLRGGSGVRHQIDAVVGDDHKRILIEAKDFDTAKVGLGIVRDFWAVVDDLKPQAAYIVTTVDFTRDAKKFAAAKRITLALLRPPRDEDWEGLIRRIVVTTTVTGQAGPPSVRWELHPDDHHKVADSGMQLGLTDTADLTLADNHGKLTPFLPLLERQLHEDYGNVALGDNQEIGRVNRLDEPTWLHAPGIAPVRVTAWAWSVRVASSTDEWIVGDAVGGLAAELVLRTVDGSIHRMFTNREVQSWTFDGQQVVPRKA